MTRNIRISALDSHPERTNYMDHGSLTKLRRLIERTGRYEPLVVRTQKASKARYEIINGYSRLQVLRAMGRKTAQCIVWKLNDDEARLCLATLNRLSGREVPERRAVLIEGLSVRHGSDELARLLPDGPKQLAKLCELASIDASPAPKEHAQSRTSTSPRQVMEFFVDQEQADKINLALDVISHSRKRGSARSETLGQLAAHFLERCPASRRP